jgi:hypothetical protein
MPQYVGAVGRLLECISQVVPVALQCPFAFRTDSEDSSGETVLWRMADPHSILLISHQRIFWFPAVKTSLKGKRFQDF